jgi:hypothetical protein
MQQLTAGDTVTVKVRNALYHARDRYASGVVGAEFREYTGTVVHEKWYGDDKIGLTTDVRGFPVRVLNRANIVEVSGAVVDYTPVKRDREVITVQGSKGNTYTVIKEGSKTSCSCPGFGFRKTCKHVQEAAM